MNSNLQTETFLVVGKSKNRQTFLDLIVETFTPEQACEAFVKFAEDKGGDAVVTAVYSSRIDITKNPIPKTFRK